MRSITRFCFPHPSKSWYTIQSCSHWAQSLSSTDLNFSCSPLPWQFTGSWSPEGVAPLQLEQFPSFISWCLNSLVLSVIFLWPFHMPASTEPQNHHHGTPKLLVCWIFNRIESLERETLKGWRCGLNVSINLRTWVWIPRTQVKPDGRCVSVIAELLQWGGRERWETVQKLVYLQPTTDSGLAFDFHINDRFFILWVNVKV